MDDLTPPLDRWLANPLTEKIAFAAIAAALVYLVVHLLHRSINRYVGDTHTRYRGRKFVSFIGYVLVALVLVATFSDRLGSLGVALGIAGAGIAFALQELIGSLAGWFALTLGNFYKTGDRVQLGGIRGDVIDIGMLRTTLMEIGQWVDGDLYNGRIVRVANSFVFKEPVFNYSADFPFLWDEISFPVRYGSDWRYARTMFEGIVKEVAGDYAAQSRDAWKNVVRKYRIEAERIEPMVTFRANEQWIEYTIRYIVDYRRRRATKDLLFTRILEEIDRSEGRVHIPTAGFELLSAPELAVRVDSSDGGEKPQSPPFARAD